MKPLKAASEMSVAELASYIDHSVLKPDFTPADVRREVENGVRYGCRTVCINPASVEIAKPLCRGTDTDICVVIDFPFGASSTDSKVSQARIALTPAELGDIRIHLTQSSQGLIARVTAGTSRSIRCLST